MKVSVTVVDLEAADRNWSKPLALIQALLAPLFVLFAIKELSLAVFGIPVPVFATLFGLVIATVITFTTDLERTPRFYHVVGAYVGFCASTLWVYGVARELVGVVTMLGVVTNLSNELLGLTLLTWANSVADLAADLAVAAQGYPRMAVSACFGGPLFNLLLGIGISFSIAVLRSDTDYLSVELTGIVKVLLGFLCWSLVSTMILLPLSRFRATRPYAVYLLAVYLTFLIVIVLVEKQVLSITSKIRAVLFKYPVMEKNDITVQLLYGFVLHIPRFHL